VFDVRCVTRHRPARARRRVPGRAARPGGVRERRQSGGGPAGAARRRGARSWSSTDGTRRPEARGRRATDLRPRRWRGPGPMWRHGAHAIAGTVVAGHATQRDDRTLLCAAGCAGASQPLFDSTRRGNQVRLPRNAGATGRW